ncbi:MAG TPA: hypothetical protein VFP40_15010, partial [Terriglobales bacterium]|nr:hypothetical protein [Terriglobales bacterium]
FAKRKRLPFYEISAVTGQGVKDLTWAMAHEVRDLREGKVPEITFEEEEPTPRPRTSKKKAADRKKAPAKKKPAAKKKVVAKKAPRKAAAKKKRTARSR